MDSAAALRLVDGPVGHLALVAAVPGPSADGAHLEVLF